MNKFTSFALIIVGLVVISYCCEDEESTKTDQSDTKIEKNLKAIEEADQEKKAPEKVEQEKKMFSFTNDEFVKNYNNSLKTLKSEQKIKIKEKSDNGEYITARMMSKNNSFGIITTSNNKNNKMFNIVFIGGSNDPVKTAESVIGITAVIMAIENPLMPVSDRTKIWEDIGITNGKLRENGKVEAKRGQIKYTATINEETGIWLNAVPE